MSDMPKIIFVDDENMILQGIKRILRPFRREWQMSFYDHARDALQAMESDGPADLVISDMRMPEINGAEFLTEVAAKYPSTIRVILSGYAEPEFVLKTVGPTHQYLSKPCDN